MPIERVKLVDMVLETHPASDGTAFKSQPVIDHQLQVQTTELQITSEQLCIRRLGWSKLIVRVALWGS